MTAQFNEILANTPVLVGGGVLLFLLLVWLVGRLTRRRSADVATDYVEIPPASSITSSPPPAFEPEPAALEEPAAIADEPIAAAAPFDASPASLAADVAAPEPAPAATPDELTRLKGVGPRLAARLNALGIASFAQIAALSPGEADALDAQLGEFQGRIHRDRWIEQAGFLATGDVAGFEGKFGKL